MDVMVVVTLVALGLSVLMAVVTARVMRAERRRSAARVAMLEAALASPPAAATAVRAEIETAPLAPAIRPAAVRSTIAEPAPLRTPAARVVERPMSDAPVATSDLFGATAGAPSGGLGFAGVAVAGAAIVALAIGAFAWSGGASSSEAVTVEVAARPLELVALSHARTGEGLTISGMVRNPAGGVSRAHLTAVVFVFDRQGSFLTSTRAPIDPVNLDPGAQSLFAVTVPQAGAVGRYRVSFRTDLGVVPHVDRRASAPVERTRG
jgi:hypothetical protein